MGFLKGIFTGPDSAEVDDKLFKNQNAAGWKDDLLTRSTGVLSAPKATIDTTQGDEFRTGQQTLAGTLAGRVAGTAPSVAELQLNQGLENNIQSQIAQAASARGASPGMVQRNLAQNLAGTNAVTNAQAGILRAQEQATAEQSLGQILSGARGQDLSTATSQAQLTAQEEIQRQALVQQYVQMGLSIDQAQFQANQALATLKTNAQLGNATNQVQNTAGVIGGAATLGAALLGA